MESAGTQERRVRCRVCVNVPAEEALIERLGSRKPTFPTGTRVHVAGLSAAGGHMEPAQVLTIRRFWEAFFAEAGAQLIEYGPEFHSL